MQRTRQRNASYVMLATIPQTRESRVIHDSYIGPLKLSLAEAAIVPYIDGSK